MVHKQPYKLFHGGWSNVNTTNFTLRQNWRRISIVRSSKHSWGISSRPVSSADFLFLHSVYFHNTFSYRCSNPAFYGCERGGSPSNIINPIISARLRTISSFSFKYGRLEINAKMPAGDWLWPALWLLPRYVI